MHLVPPEWGKTGFGASIQSYTKENIVMLTGNTPFPNDYSIGEPILYF